MAAKPLGWEPVAFAEIEPFPSAVLAHHYPDLPNVGDVTAQDWSQYRDRCDVVIGGSPCQAFSVAGRRESLADERGNLTLAFVEAVNAVDPAFVVWENVPGVLNTRDNAFGCFLAALAGDDRPFVAPDGGAWSNAGVVVGSRRALAWRMLDAQYFGVPQRRRRVFVVGCPRSSGIDPSEILFEAEGCRGDSSARREAEKDIAGTIEASTGRSRGAGISPGAIVGAVSSKWAKGTGGPAGDECQNLVTAPLTGNPYGDNVSRESTLVVGTLTGSMGFAGPDENDAARGMYIPVVSGTLGGGSGDRGWCNDLDRSGAFVAHTLRGDGFDASEDGTGRGTPLIAFSCKDDGGDAGHLSPTLRSLSADKSHDNGGGQVAIAFHGSQDPDVSGDVTHPIGRNHGQETCVAYTVSLRGREGGCAAELGGETAGALRASQGGGDKAHVLTNSVRRLTPRECERLQGLPDDYTLVPWRGGMAPDGPRYKAIGNGMAVPCVQWIFERINSAMRAQPIQKERT